MSTVDPDSTDSDNQRTSYRRLRKTLPKLKRLHNSVAMNRLQGGTAVVSLPCNPTDPPPKVPNMPTIGPVVTMPIAIYSFFAGC